MGERGGDMLGPVVLYPGSMYVRQTWGVLRGQALREVQSKMVNWTPHIA